MNISNVIQWIISNMDQIANIAAWLISGSSIIVFFSPQLADNHVFKGVLRLLGKIALNRSNPKS